MGLLLFTIFIVGVYAVTKEATKGWRENQKELDALRSEQEKYNSNLFGTKGYEFFKKRNEGKK